MRLWSVGGVETFRKVPSHLPSLNRRLKLILDSCPREGGPEEDETRKGEREGREGDGQRVGKSRRQTKEDTPVVLDKVRGDPTFGSRRYPSDPGVRCPLSLSPQSEE